MINSEIYKVISSKKNIYKAIYSVNSYIFDKELLKKSDIEILIKLNDKFNSQLIEKTIKEVQTQIERILIDDELFNISVFFRPKKYDREINKIKFRPLHSANLYTQIAIVSMLNVIVFDYGTTNGELENEVNFSDLVKLIPENFYGNIPSLNSRYLFKPWPQMYKKYSKDTTEHFNKYLESKEYNYEVSLDLVNFFPSINPVIILEMVADALKHKFSGNENNHLKKVLFKLLYFHIENITQCSELYYGNVECNHGLSIGIVQGLPQAYFFGSICMIEVAKKYEKIIKGKGFYYVDDSVIYTNDTGFDSKLKNINNKLLKFSTISSKKHKILSEISEKYSQSVIELSDNLTDVYIIKVHDNGGKSSHSPIKSARAGRSFIGLGREASMGAIALTRSFSDIEDLSLSEKFKALTKSIEDEITRVSTVEDVSSDPISSNTLESKHYRKLLVRFKKFFKFRYRLLNYRINLDFDPNTVIKAITIDDSNSENPFKRFFTEYDEDIFLTEFKYILKNNKKTGVAKLRKSLKKFDAEVFQDNLSEDFSFFSKVFNGISDIKKISIPGNYDALSAVIDLNYLDYSNAHEPKKITEVKRIATNLSKIKPFEYKSLLKAAGINFRGISSIPTDYVITTSTNIQRMILNAVFSKLFNVLLSDDFQISKLDSKPLKYFEFKILAYLRNKNFSFDQFVKYINNISYDHYNSTIDYGIFEAIDYFNKYVSCPVLIENLINIHKYTSDIWKNGSKFLHFYTLHNHEHALELIKQSTKIVNAISFINLKSIDYYILFISCYLHDISMVLHPDLTSTFDSNPEEAYLIFSRYRDDLTEIIQNQSNAFAASDIKIKNLLIDYYKHLDSFFESHVRNRHAKQSAKFIRDSTDLNFIDKAYKELVAKVSEAHCYDIEDVYNVKYGAKTTLFSEKYLKIILRLADVLDMSKDRITTPILNNNIEQMSDVSKFHWLSHNIIKNCDIKVEYENSPTPGSLIAPKVMVENIIIEIQVNNSNHLKFPNSKKCKFVELENGVYKKCLNLRVKNQQNTGDLGCNTDCVLICRWLSKKNEYLYKELFALKKYLNRNQDNYFKSDIKIRIIFIENDPTSTKQIRFIQKYLSKG